MGGESSLCKLDAFTLEFGAGSEDAHGNADSAESTESVGRHHKDEVESIRREQFDGPRRQTSLCFLNRFFRAFSTMIIK